MTDLRSSQDAVEVWVVDTDRLVVSQATAEVWVRWAPGTTMIVSQAVSELWLDAASGVTRFVISQAVAEVWGAIPTTKVFWLSSQTI